MLFREKKTTFYILLTKTESWGPYHNFSFWYDDWISSSKILIGLHKVDHWSLKAFNQFSIIGQTIIHTWVYLQKTKKISSSIIPMERINFSININYIDKQAFFFIDQGGPHESGTSFYLFDLSKKYIHSSYFEIYLLKNACVSYCLIYHKLCG